jgi:hypothetical protein
MVLAMRMASPRMFCRYVARESIESLPPNTGSVWSAVSDGLVRPCKLVSMALAVAIASEVGSVSLYPPRTSRPEGCAVKSGI